MNTHVAKMHSLNVSALTMHLSPSENYHPVASIPDDNVALCFNVTLGGTFTFTKIKLPFFYSDPTFCHAYFFTHNGAIQSPLSYKRRYYSQCIVNHPRKLYLLEFSFIATANIVEIRVAHYLALSETKGKKRYKRPIQFNDSIEREIKDYGG